MAGFKWKPLDEYSAFARVLAVYMWEQRPPLNPAQFATLTGIEYMTVYRWFQNNATPEPAHLLKIAQKTSFTVQELFEAATFGSPDFPLFSLTEAWDHIYERVMASQTIGLEDHALALRVLKLVRAEELPAPLPAVLAGATTLEESDEE